MGSESVLSFRGWKEGKKLGLIVSVLRRLKRGWIYIHSMDGGFEREGLLRA